MDLDAARQLYALSGVAQVAAPTHSLSDPEAELPDVVLTEGPATSTFVYPTSLLLREGFTIEHLDDEERDEYLDGVLYAAGLR